MSRDTFVLADEGADGYHDYLNFGGSSIGEGEEFEEERPTRATKGKKGSSKSGDKIDWQSDMDRWKNKLNPWARNDAPETSATLEESPNLKKIPPKQVAEHQGLMLCLQRYASSETFQPYLKAAGIRLVDLENKSVAELKALTTRVRVVCNAAGNTTGMLGHGILMACGGVEKMAPKRLIDLDGFQNSLKHDREFAMLAEQMEIDMGLASSMTTTQRMGLCLAKNAASVNAANKEKNKLLAQLVAQQQQMINMQNAQQCQRPQAEPSLPIHPPPVEEVIVQQGYQEPVAVRSNIITGARPIYD